jgi:hypothetical protein
MLSCFLHGADIGDSANELKAKGNLAMALVDLGEFALAEVAFGSVADAFAVQLGSGHWETEYVQAGLANCMLEQGRVAEALEILEVVAPGLTAQLGALDPQAAWAARVLLDARAALDAERLDRTNSGFLSVPVT